MTLRKATLIAACLLLVACSEPEKPASEEAEPPAPAALDSEAQVPAEPVIPEQEPEAPAPVADEPEPQIPLSADIWLSPTEVTVSDAVLHLSSELWLNRMPVIGDDGTKPADKLHASVKLLSADMQALPAGIEVTQVLLEQADKQWLVKDNLEVRAEGEMSLEVVLRGGPEWAPGSKVNIAVNIAHEGEEYTLVQHDVVLAEVF